MNGFFLWVLFAGLVVLSAIIGVEDVQSRIIRHRWLGLLLIICSILAYQIGNWQFWQHAFLILLIGLILFAFNVVGAGDVKLLTIFSIAITPTNLSLTMVMIALLGGILAIFQLFFAKWVHGSWRVEKGVPYALPICMSSLLTVAMSIAISI